jgi:hypothetical protein
MGSRTAEHRSEGNKLKVAKGIYKKWKITTLT